MNDTLNKFYACRLALEDKLMQDIGLQQEPIYERCGLVLDSVSLWHDNGDGRTAIYIDGLSYVIDVGFEEFNRAKNNDQTPL